MGIRQRTLSSLVQRKNKVISGSKKFQYHVIPKEPGTYDFFNIQWVFFNSVDKKYDTLKSEMLLEVKGMSTKNKKIESNYYDNFYKRIKSEENKIIKIKNKNDYLLFLNFVLLSLISIMIILIINKYR